MGLTYAKEEQLRKQPILQVSMRKSDDGRFIVHKTVITDIKPVAYIEKVLANEGTEFEDEEA